MPVMKAMENSVDRISTCRQARKLQKTREKQLGDLHAASEAGTTYKSERIGR